MGQNSAKVDQSSIANPSIEKRVKEVISVSPPPNYALPEAIERPATGGIRFKVHDVEVKLYAGAMLSPQDSWYQLRRSWALLGPAAYVSPVNESPTRKVVRTFGSNNLFAYMAYVSFFQHYPIRISPDVIWIVLLQGLMIHIKEQEKQKQISKGQEARQRDGGNTQEYPMMNENHKRESVHIICPGITEAAVEEAIRNTNLEERSKIPWDDTIPSFLQQIQEESKTEVRPLLVCSFSTTTHYDRMCSHITVRNQIQRYVEFNFFSGCGYPWIELTGTSTDWERLRSQVQESFSHSSFNLEWWLKYLIPVLDEFVDAANGKVNLTFWRACVFRGGQSGYGGKDPMTGWVQTLFPYVEYGGMESIRYVRNEYLGCWMEDNRCSATVPSDLDEGEADGEVGKEHIHTQKPNGQGIEVFPSGVNETRCNVSATHASSGEVVPVLDMIYSGGLIALMYDEETHALEVQTGYAVLQPRDALHKQKGRDRNNSVNNDCCVCC